MDFVKIDPEAPPGFYEYEAAGLRWLAVDGGVPVAPVLDVSPGKITVPRYETVEPTMEAAFEFGARLAETHAAGADWFGCPPPQWRKNGYIGHLTLPLAVRDPGMAFHEFFVTYRVEPFVRRALSDELLDMSDLDMINRFIDLVLDGAIFDPDSTPSRIHGDMWCGNLVWTPAGGLLIDPAAHGGHFEADLAMLQLFGFRHFDAVLAGYDSVTEVDAGWEERFLAHQIHPLLVHTVFFGEAYSDHVMSVVRRFV